MDQIPNTPRYTPAEEICICLVHFAGAVATVIGSYWLVKDSTSESFVIAALIYGVAIFSMFATSTMYHAIRDQEVKAFVRKFDHAMIYFAIGGTYVPIVNALVPTVQGMIWYGGLGLCAVVGAVSSFLTLKHKYITTAVYLVMGWASLLLLPKMLHMPEEFHASGSRMAGMLI
ncbi:MAG: hemolysin III family protein, partial [Lentisphaeria bacterium]|nr:hemolysin III family protein [Lentisphaeria bacterium]